ncbi:tRNA pseudouridine synthase A [Bifidobacterium sp. ESL0728]|uniref:tRNA pseudouridine synthase A n=1 Tax=Bifidobacterium sp. ESL0728 TaxID=2983220 RepID=UPI0023F91112|nr:tRNA pseudouridine synthase A [Bifidobacterium sp. ESL0728]WEV59452.1 tRNA pseudouridine synthase A [Bifidobacterium sp. ESL0728]
MRLRIDLAYDGGGFHGWAKQPGLRTVQGVVETALHTVLRVPADDADEPLRLVVAGRTDTGVHAAHQVCHLDVGEQTLERCVGHMEVSPIEALRRRLAHDLPDDISLHNVQVAPVGFDARFSALERTYVYRIADGERPADPRLRSFVWNIEDVLDIPAMNEAAAMTIGLHDFGSFATPNPGGTTIREVKQAVWRRVPVMGMYGGAIGSYNDSWTVSASDQRLSGQNEYINSNANETSSAVSSYKVDNVTSVRSGSNESMETGSVADDGVNGPDSREIGDSMIGEAAEMKSNAAAGMNAIQSMNSVIVEGSKCNSEEPQAYVVPSLESGLVCFTIVADAFAHNMVRSLVNACVQVGRHRKSLDWFAQKMANPVREGSTGPIAACGLTLEHVAYPPDDELASRAASIRARRTLPE